MKLSLEWQERITMNEKSEMEILYEQYLEDDNRIFEKDGMVCLVPVAVYPKKYVEDLKKEVSELKKDIKSGRQRTYDNIDDMIASLEK